MKFRVRYKKGRRDCSWYVEAGDIVGAQVKFNWEFLFPHVCDIYRVNENGHAWIDEDDKKETK